MQFKDYANKYGTINFTRSAEGVLEMTIHTRGGPALWGSSVRGLHKEMGEAFADLSRDPENKVLILTGTGDTFLTGMDRVDVKDEPTFAQMWERIYEEGVALLENLLAIPVPVIGAVNGPATIHAELLVLSDIVLAADHAVFADIAHMPGAVPSDGVHVVWPMLLGPNRGRYFLLTNEHIDAAEAKRLGVVAEVMPLPDLLPRARELGAKLAELPLRNLRHTRRMMIRDIRRRMREDLEVGIAVEALAMLTV